MVTSVLPQIVVDLTVSSPTWTRHKSTSASSLNTTQSKKMRAGTQFIEDEPPEEGSPEAEVLREVEADVEARADAWVHRIQCDPPSFLWGHPISLVSGSGSS